jgi:hypothetical protein
MDPHKRSVTIEVMTGDEAVLGGCRFANDRNGYKALLRCAKQWPKPLAFADTPKGDAGCLGRLCWQR